MTAPSSYKGKFEAADQFKSAVVSFTKALTGNYPVMRFQKAGRIVGAYFFPMDSSSGTNLLQVGIRNGGNAAGGTIQTAPQSTGTVVAGSANALAVATDGKEIYAEGDFVVANITTTIAPTNVVIQIDYVIDNQ